MLSLFQLNHHLFFLQSVMYHFSVFVIHLKHQHTVVQQLLEVVEQQYVDALDELQKLK